MWRKNCPVDTSRTITGHLVDTLSEHPNHINTLRSLSRSVLHDRDIDRDKTETGAERSNSGCVFGESSSAEKEK